MAQLDPPVPGTLRSQNPEMVGLGKHVENEWLFLQGLSPLDPIRASFFPVRAGAAGWIIVAPTSRAPLPHNSGQPGARSDDTRAWIQGSHEAFSVMTDRRLGVRRRILTSLGGRAMNGLYCY